LKHGGESPKSLPCPAMPSSPALPSLHQPPYPFPLSGGPGRLLHDIFEILHCQWRALGLFQRWLTRANKLGSCLHSMVIIVCIHQSEYGCGIHMAAMDTCQLTSSGTCVSFRDWFEITVDLCSIYRCFRLTHCLAVEWDKC